MSSRAPRWRRISRGHGVGAQQLQRGRYSGLFRNGAILAGIALPALISVVRRKPSRTATIASGLLSIAGALALKWSIVHAGRESADAAAYPRHLIHNWNERKSPSFHHRRPQNMERNQLAVGCFSMWSMLGTPRKRAARKPPFSNPPRSVAYIRPARADLDC